MVKETNSKGQFVKGSSGNPSGRPASSKLTQADKDVLVKIIRDNVPDKNLLSEMLEFMLKRAENIADVHKYLKEYAPFLTPKLSSIKQDIVEEKTIIIKIEGVEEMAMVDRTPGKVLIDDEDNNNNNKGE